ncbi:FAD-dependent oxidoreductase [Acetobacterium carbinolicum]|uniref:FAD-dependent oxidoreductase n=1 Tax=Acetobacterium carbinolicum TaxID=52690 RepID=UPI0039C90C74
MKKILIVGGVAGGATAAARLRRLSEEDEIILFERDEYISFANCGLPYYIGDVIKDRKKLLVQTVDGMSKRFNLDIRNFSEVVAIDPVAKTVEVKNHQTGKTYNESYDKLILSPGAKPIAPPIPGLSEAKNILTLRNIPDTDKIKAVVDSGKVRRAVVIGGGFIGVEMAENLQELGANVTLVEKMNQVLKPLDFEMAQLVHQEINANCVNLILGDGVDHFQKQGSEVVLESGRVLEADLVILAIGVVPDNMLAKQANLKCGPRGHIVTTQNYEVLSGVDESVYSDIFAIGDAIEVKDFVTKDQTAIPLAWPANRQGRVVADYINGKTIKNFGIQGTAVAKVFNKTIASTGNNAVQLDMKKIDYQIVMAHRANHAGYYPHATNIALKLLYDPKTLSILGAQAVGQEGTEKRIDVIASAMKMGATVLDLQDFELCYAPPFSSAKDPANILGYIAENIEDGVYKTVEWHEIDAIVEKGGFLLDVRSPVEVSAGAIKGSVNIELDSLRDRIAEIPISKDTPIYVTCQVGQRAYLAIRILKGNGFTNIYNLSGGYSTYRTAHYKLAELDFNIGACIVKKVDSDDGDVDQGGRGSDGEQGGTGNDVIKKKVDVTGLQCPGPLMATYDAIKSVESGDLVQIIATDFGFVSDIKSWCETNGHTLVSQETKGKSYISIIRKGSEGEACSLMPAISTQKNATLVVFSGELDKVLASMIIAQGAAAQGKNVTLFFTFWGLNALRKRDGKGRNKTFVEKMFGAMMPKGAGRLPLSMMNMLGAGPAMIKGIMKKKHVDDLDTMIKKAQNAGVRFIACTMSMDLMGIKEEELIDGIEYAGVGTYIASNENAGTTLFV